MEINLMDFITKEFIFIVPCLIVLGICLKNIPFIPDYFIPLILIVLGIIIAGFYHNWTNESIIQGFICGLASTGLHQTVKQIKKKE